MTSKTYSHLPFCLRWILYLHCLITVALNFLQALPHMQIYIIMIFPWHLRLSTRDYWVTKWCKYPITILFLYFLIRAMRLSESLTDKIWNLINVSNPIGKTLPIMRIFVSRHSETEWRIGWHLMNLELWLLLGMIMGSLLLEGALRHMEIVRLEILRPSRILLPIIWFYLMQLQCRDTVKSIK